jgi:3-oxoacyl-[acyl-carrier protein] reductase
MEARMNKVAFVTGASSEIGREIAVAFAKHGYDVALTYRHNKVEADKTESLVKKVGVKTELFCGDLASEEMVQKMFTEILDKFGRLDVLVNVAGGANLDGEMPNTTYEYWVKTFDDNLFSTALCSQAAIKIMLKQEGIGKIINISSVLGEHYGGRPGIVAYSAAKAAVINLTETLAKQFAPKILVNSVSPGRTFTLPYKKMSPEKLEEMVKPNKIGRFIKPEEIAQMTLTVAQNDAVTGETISVNGGFFLRD